MIDGRLSTLETGACFVSSVYSVDAGNLPGGLVSLRPPARTGELVWHRWVDDSRVPPKHRAYVQRHLEAACGMLGMDHHVDVRFFYDLPPGTRHDEVADHWYVAQEPGDEVMGFLMTRWTRTIAVNVGVRGPIVAGVVAHEARHLHQNRLRTITNGSLYVLTHPERVEVERDAAEFALDYVNALYPRKVA